MIRTSKAANALKPGRDASRDSPPGPRFQLFSLGQGQSPRTHVETRVRNPGPQRAKIARTSLPHAWTQPIPAIVDEVVNAPGQPLDVFTRAALEARFNYDFGKVRVHSDARAAQAARAVRARAFTVENDIVMAAGQFAPATRAGELLLAHELAHVVQQVQTGERAIQRQDENNEHIAPGRDEMIAEILCGRGGAGLFGRSSIDELFRLSGTFFTSPPALARAEIEDRRTGKRDLYHVGSWLDDEWQIVQIELNQVRVVSATCGTEEILGLQKESAKPTELTVEVSETNFGPGTVKISDNCGTIHFEPRDKSKPPQTWTMVTKGENDQFFIRDGDDTNLFPPPQVEDFFRLYLLGDRCGTPKPKSSEPEETPEDLTRSR